MTTKPLTPMMQQWHQCKKQAKDALLLFRLGDFYEAFFEDAIEVAKRLQLTLTKRQDVPMCGVPFHASEGYIDKLVMQGCKVAIAEQMENPAEVKGIVKRQVTRIVTPGTLIDSALLQDRAHNFLTAIARINATYGIASLDLSTGLFSVFEVESDRELVDELQKIAPSELLLSEKVSLPETFTCPTTKKEAWQFDIEIALDTLKRHFSVQSLDGFGLKGMNTAVGAAGALLTYVKEELSLPTEHIHAIELRDRENRMAIDRTTQMSLELLDALLPHIDLTQTPMGARFIKQSLLSPLLSVEAIEKRQEGVKALLGIPLPHLSDVRDLERLMMRISSGYASARDVVSLCTSLEAIPHLRETLFNLDAPILTEIATDLSDVTKLTEQIRKTLSDNPPLRLSDGYTIRTGYHIELDSLRDFQKNGKKWLAQYQESLRESLGIRTLKLGYSKAFGYYIDVSRAQSPLMPPTFHKRQTLVNNERFISPELKDYEEKILTSEDQVQRLETLLFEELVQEVAKWHKEVLQIASAIALLDMLSSFSHLAHEKRYCCPKVDHSDTLHIVQGRHAVIEDENFIPNDTELGENHARLALLTGPNMAGKSTYIRQVALIAILAQMGSFVPATSAHIGIIDKVFSRIGASDDLARGQSTFMVEMSETANILNNATNRSLVILDEIGRGTSTYDGIAIAWAVAEYLLTEQKRQAKTLFATHYWELTSLQDKIPGAKNFTVAVKETEGGIVFLHKILPGGTDKSYGIHVAKLAGIPHPVITKANAMLGKLEKIQKKPKSAQMDLFSSSQRKEESDIISDLKELKIEEMKPIDALLYLERLKKKLCSNG